MVTDRCRYRLEWQHDSVRIETTDLFINLDCKGLITVKLHFVDPVSVQKIPDREGHHGLDKRKDVCGHPSNGDAQKGQKVQADYEQLFTSVVTFRRCDDQKVYRTFFT